MNKGFTVQVDKNANYLGEEDKGRTLGKIDGGTVQPGTGRSVKWGNKRAESGRNLGKLRSNT